jgi:hypothetical protein
MQGPHESLLVLPRRRIRSHQVGTGTGADHDLYAGRFRNLGKILHEEIIQSSSVTIVRTVSYPQALGDLQEVDMIAYGRHPSDAFVGNVVERWT